jgi:pimeloyl-ACP methyl ester carboxylesterase
MTIKNLQHPHSGNINYSISGLGPAIVWLHGFTENRTIWQHHIAFIGEAYTHIAINLPGTGESDLPGTPLTIEDMALSVKAVLDAEHIASCIMVGHSMGGYAALAFAAQYPAMLNGMCLYHSSAFADNEEKKINRQKSINLIRNDGKDVFVKAMVPNLFAEAFVQTHPGVIATMTAEALKVDAASLIAYYEAMIKRPDRTLVLEQVPCPVQFIIGGQDNAVPYTQSMQQAHLPGISWIHILKDTGHMGMYENPEACAAFIRDFAAFCL